MLRTARARQRGLLKRGDSETVVNREVIFSVKYQLKNPLRAGHQLDPHPPLARLARSAPLASMEGRSHLSPRLPPITDSASRA